MKSNKLGHSSIDVSSLGLGANYVGGHNLYNDVDEAEGVRLVQHALDSGINHIDTADAYGFGRSEELISEAIKGRRDQVVLATKGSKEFGEFGDGINNSPEFLRGALERSLKRLKVDYVDLYYIHHYDKNVPVEESFGAILEFKREGLIRAAGVSNFNIEQLQRAASVGPVDALQCQYNLLQRDAEQELIPWCLEHGTSFIPWGVLAYGLLGGRYQRDMKLGDKDWRQRTGMFDGDRYQHNLDVVEQLKRIGEEAGAPPAHLTMQWLMSKPVITSVIAGAKSVGQVSDNVAASLVSLSDEQLRNIDDLTKPDR